MSLSGITNFTCKSPNCKYASYPYRPKNFLPRYLKSIEYKVANEYADFIANRETWQQILKSNDIAEEDIKNWNIYTSNYLKSRGIKTSFSMNYEWKSNEKTILEISTDSMTL